MDKYYCHKVVEASRAAKVILDEGHSTVIDEHGVEHRFPTGRCPNQGDYVVKYEDGYFSWSPRAAFESGYSPEHALPFSGALVALKEGKKVARMGWNATTLGIKMFAVLMPKLDLPSYNTQEPGPKVNDRTAKFIGNDTPLNSQPYFALFTDREGANWQPGWVPSTSDLLVS